MNLLLSFGAAETAGFQEKVQGTDLVGVNLSEKVNYRELKMVLTILEILS